MSEYSEEQYLMISGIQHFAFCRRQWALIHLEQQWQENERTVDGKIMHERCHDEDQTEMRGDLLVTRGMRVESRKLGVSGICDVVEFHRHKDGVSLFGRDGSWKVVPVEYKKGIPKKHNADALQLCLQAMCLEEMLLSEIPQGFLYYGERRRRETVNFSDSLRQEAVLMLEEMHAYLERGYTPKVKPSKSCRACSLVEICLPKLCTNVSAVSYVNARIREEDA